ncbi:MAG: hypothetical protein KA141_02780 [Rubrivivax sp.]|jgi:hypothetical protein|nr:hypothetical protein [Rubrivivax sp.]
MRTPFPFALPVLATALLTFAALPATAAGPLTPGQMDAASQVFVGTANCEFNNSITVTAIEGQPGHFKLQHKKATYTLVPQETTTGAVRLEDTKAGVVWLQIPAKSMLMNAKLGQRVADGCQMNEQMASK